MRHWKVFIRSKPVAILVREESNELLNDDKKINDLMNANIISFQVVEFVVNSELELVTFKEFGGWLRRKKLLPHR